MVEDAHSSRMVMSGRRVWEDDVSDLVMSSEEEDGVSEGMVDKLGSVFPEYFEGTKGDDVIGAEVQVADSMLGDFDSQIKNICNIKMKKVMVDLLQEGEVATGERQKNRAINEGLIERDNSKFSCMGETNENPTVNTLQNFLSKGLNGSGGVLGLVPGHTISEGLGLNSRPSSFTQDGLNDGCKNQLPKDCVRSGPKKLKRRNKRTLSNLGKHVKVSSSYFACIIPRSESNRDAPKSKRSKAKNKEVSDESISNCESFSSPSITDSDILRCNFRSCKGTWAGKKLWGTIEALGVVSGRDDSENARLIDEMEFHDKEGVVVKKGELINSS